MRSVSNDKINNKIKYNGGFQIINIINEILDKII